tara:strand:- start:30696 stop:31181 length:486 start_codon:yes stop_codon:yes gene_type:complete
MQVERPVDTQKTRILGFAIEKELEDCGRFNKVTVPFPHYQLKRDKEKCFGIDVSTIATPPRKGSHFYSIMFIIPDSLKQEHISILGDDTYDMHFLLHNRISSIMSKYSIIKGVSVRKGYETPEGHARKIAMKIRMEAMQFKGNYDQMMKEINKSIESYAKR